MRYGYKREQACRGKSFVKGQPSFVNTAAKSCSFRPFRDSEFCFLVSAFRTIRALLTPSAVIPPLRVLVSLW